jgi:hypothetical protein
VFDAVAGLALRQRDEWDRDTRLAWRIADLVMATWAKGRPPDLQALLTQGHQARPQSLVEQKAALAIIAQRLGRPLTTKADRMMQRKVS